MASEQKSVIIMYNGINPWALARSRTRFIVITFFPYSICLDNHLHSENIDPDFH